MVLRLGEKIKELRKSKGYTQGTPAERPGVPYRAVSKWERNANLPDVALLPALAEAPEVTPDDLFSIERQKNTALRS